MMNLDEIPIYIPPNIKDKTPEQHCRAELARYYSGDTLERGVIVTLDHFRMIGDIKQFDFCEENYTIDGRSCIRLVWKKRLPLQ
jgi:hypothetical protein